MNATKHGGNVNVDTNYRIDPPDPANPDIAFRKDWGPTVVVRGKTMMTKGRIVTRKTGPRRARSL